MNDSFSTSPSLGDGPQLLAEPRACEAGAGARWLSQAWTLFKAQPGLWLGMSVVFLVVMMVLNFIPFVNLVLGVGFGVLAAGWIVAAYELDEKQNLKFEQLLAGFSRHTGQLFLLGLLYVVGLLLCVVVALIVALVFGGASVMGMTHQGGTANGFEMLAMLLGFLVAMALMVPLAMSIWFAPALIAFNGMDAIAAMKLSFHACWLNMLPFLIYGLVLMGLLFLCLLTCGLGLLVLLPIMYISYYTSYRAVLTEG